MQPVDLKQLLDLCRASGSPDEATEGSWELSRDQFVEVYQQQLRRACLAVTLENAGELGEVFTLFDANGDGTLSLPELQDAFEKLSPSAVERQKVEDLFEEIDSDGDGRVSIGEFTLWLSSAQRYPSHGAIPL